MNPKRPEYKRGHKADQIREAFSKMSVEDLQLSASLIEEKLKSVLKVKKVQHTEIYRLRGEELKKRGVSITSKFSKKNKTEELSKKFLALDQCVKSFGTLSELSSFIDHIQKLTGV